MTEETRTRAGWLERLRRLWPGSAAASENSPSLPSPADDPRHVPLPVYGDVLARNGFEALALWEADEAEARQMLAQRLADARRGGADSITTAPPGPADCAFGQWLVALRPEGHFDLLDDLKMWHDHWHRLHRQMVEELAQGQTGAAEDALGSAPSPWTNAARRVRGLLEALWLQRPMPALELRTPGRTRWLEARLLREADGGERLTVSVRRELPVGALVIVRDTHRPAAPSRPYRVDHCRPGQRGLLDRGVYIAYLVA